jgi:hypothetical protein
VNADEKVMPTRLNVPDPRGAAIEERSKSKKVRFDFRARMIIEATHED